MVKMTTKKTLILGVGALLIATWLVYRNRNSSQASNTGGPAVEVDQDASGTRTATMAEVLQLARESLESMKTQFDDYTTTFVKQEIDTNGVMTEETEVFMKVQTRMRNDTDDAPLRVYMRFERPESVKGREVIWGKDLYSGYMQVKEAGLLGMMTIALDPNGMIAMRGQRYPISEIGIVKLVEKLIERGLQDVDNPDISVTISSDHQVGDVAADLIQVRRAKPSGQEDDFALAEIAFDPERKLILSYRSFGWPSSDAAVDADLPLLESYNYNNVKTNVGLTDADFDTANPAYTFP
jgi:hypothetical protein